MADPVVLIVILTCCFIIGLAVTVGIPIPEFRWVCSYCRRPLEKSFWSRFKWAADELERHPITTLKMLKNNDVPLACAYCEERRQRGEKLERKAR